MNDFIHSRYYHLPSFFHIYCSFHSFPTHSAYILLICNVIDTSNRIQRRKNIFLLSNEMVSYCCACHHNEGDGANNNLHTHTQAETRGGKKRTTPRMQNGQIMTRNDEDMMFRVEIRRKKKRNRSWQCNTMQSIF